MSQVAPPSDKTGKSSASPSAPPDERFWQRYSPHAELPLSSAGSFVLHILAFGLMILMAWLGTVLFNQSNRSLPIEAVRLSGGGGNPHARGTGPNNDSELVEAENRSEEKQATDTVPSEVAPPAEIKIDPIAPTKPEFSDPSRKIQMEKSDNTLKQLSMRAGKIRTPGSNSPSGSSFGQGGPGSGGGSGDGKGPGIGSGDGPGANTPTQREKRMLRWSMLFNTPNSADYVAQLRGLHAILAIPVREDANGSEYQIIRDLSARPAKLENEDIRSIQRLVRWADENPDSVRGVMAVLGVKKNPSHFLAFMPVELEEKLLRLEIDYLRKRHPGHKEDDIEGTKFRINIRKGNYEPEVKEQKLK